MTSNEIGEPPNEQSLDLLRAVIGADSISSYSRAKISNGQGRSIFRIHLQYALDSAESEQSSVILKSVGTRSDSPQSESSHSLYEQEFRFNHQINPELLRTSTNAVPKCYHASLDPSSETGMLLLQDAGEQATKGNDIGGATVDQARLAMAELGRLHSSSLRKSAERDTLQGKASNWPGGISKLTGALIAQLFSDFKSRYGHIILPEYMEVCSRLVAAFDQYTERFKVKCMQGLIHGDYRLDNMLFAAKTVDEGRPESTAELAVTIVGWKYVTWAPLLSDVAYFFGCALQIDDRRAWTEELLQSYCDAVGEQDGDPLMPLDVATAELRVQSFFGVAMR